LPKPRSLNKHPGASSYIDRTGKPRWRFRRDGKSTPLPYYPGHPEFEAAYRALAPEAGMRRAVVVEHPGRCTPGSLRDAWLRSTRTSHWQHLEITTRQKQVAIAERFLMSPLPGVPGATCGDFPLDRLQRRHVKAILDARSDTPHAAQHVLRLIRKLIAVGLDEEWITVDPTHMLEYSPPLKGHRSWTPQEREAFEAAWPVGSTPRLVYALALYTGARCSDIAGLRWSDIEDGGIHIRQQKTGNPIWVPLHPTLREILDSTERRGQHIVIKARGGGAYTAPLLSRLMHDWIVKARLPAGVTLHGLRKTMGAALADSGATTKEIMAVLGHEAMQHAELYTKGAEQRLLAKAAMQKLSRAKIRAVE
jgi:integrase